jgi:nucleolar protein 15
VNGGMFMAGCSSSLLSFVWSQHISAMSSTAVKKAKVKTVARTKTKQSLAEHDAIPASSSKGHKPKPLTKGKEHTDKTKSKPVSGEETKPATSTEETHHDTVSDTRNHAKGATRPGRRLRGPWRAPSSSPSLSAASDLEDEPEAPQEEDGADEENVHLYGFSTDEDSSDDDLDVDDEAVLDVGSLPTVARDDASVKRKLERAKQKPVRASCLLITHPEL